MQNVMLKKFREERILYESEPSSDISRDQLSAEANNLRKKDLLNLSDFLERNRKDTAIENIPASGQNQNNEEQNNEEQNNEEQNYEGQNNDVNNENEKLSAESTEEKKKNIIKRKL